MYRVNSKGEFNVPFGDNKNPLICDEVNLKKVSLALQKVTINHADYKNVLKKAKKGDFVYFDPPYNGTYDKYTPSLFRDSSHGRLARLCKDLDKRGVKWVQSNSDTPLVRYLYEGFKITVLDTRYEINVDAAGRASQELLISNVE
jgi:DNA adenine methylase